MTPFDRRWLRLAAAARRAPRTPRPDDIDHLQALLARSVPMREDWVLPSWLGWAAAACLLASALSLPWTADVLAAPEDLAPPAPTLPALPKPPRLPMPPTLPDLHALVQSVTSEESLR